ncbi:hypothetical protein KCU65_g365, partial [Aureobasidium melanogenum]
MDSHNTNAVPYCSIFCKVRDVTFQSPSDVEFLVSTIKYAIIMGTSSHLALVLLVQDSRHCNLVQSRSLSFLAAEEIRAVDASLRAKNQKAVVVFSRLGSNSELAADGFLLGSGAGTTTPSGQAEGNLAGRIEAQKLFFLLSEPMRHEFSHLQEYVRAIIGVKATDLIKKLVLCFFEERCRMFVVFCSSFSIHIQLLGKIGGTRT